GSVKPPRPRAPARRKSRRLTLSQNRVLPPHRVNTASASLKSDETISRILATYRSRLARLSHRASKRNNSPGMRWDLLKKETDNEPGITESHRPARRSCSRPDKYGGVPDPVGPGPHDPRLDQNHTDPGNVWLRNGWILSFAPGELSQSKDRA